MAGFVGKKLPGKKLLKKKKNRALVVFLSPTFSSFTYLVRRQLDVSLRSDKCLCAASTEDQHTECHAVGMAHCQPLLGAGGVCRNIRKVFTLGDFSLWLGKWDICTHREDKITK